MADNIALVPPTKIMGKLKIDKDDLINIAVAHHEEELITRKERLEEIIKECKRREDKFYKKMKRSCEEHVSSVRKEKLDAAVKALQVAGFDKLDYVLDIHWDLYGKRGYFAPSPMASSDEDISDDSDDPEDLDKNKIGIFYHVFLRGFGRSTDSIKNYESLPFGEEQLKIREEWHQNSLRLEKAEIELKDAEKQLSEMSRLERKARAMVSLKVLKKSKEGRDLLQSLQDLKTKTLSLDVEE